MLESGVPRHVQQEEGGYFFYANRQMTLPCNEPPLRSPGADPSKSAGALLSLMRPTKLVAAGCGFPLNTFVHRHRASDL